MQPSRPWGLARVSGRSMLPTLRPGDRLLVRYGAAVHEDDLVMARFGDGTLAVKRVAYAVPTAAGSPGWYLTSDNPAEGVDSRHRGPVEEQAVLAVVRGRVWPRPRRAPFRSPDQH